MYHDILVNVKKISEIISKYQFPVINLDILADGYYNTDIGISLKVYYTLLTERIKDNGTSETQTGT